MAEGKDLDWLDKEGKEGGDDLVGKRLENAELEEERETFPVVAQPAVRPKIPRDVKVSAKGALKAERTPDWRVKRWYEPEDSTWAVPRSDTMELLRRQFGEMTVRSARESGILGHKPAPFVSPSVRTSSPLDLGTASGRGLEQSDLYNRSDVRSERSEFHSLRPEASEQRDLNYGGRWEGQTPGRWGPPPLAVNTFDGSSHNVAVFLSQILNHFELYGHYYPSNWSMIIAATGVLVGEAYEWAADMFRTRATELEDIGYFLAALRKRFEDTTTDKRAEGDLLAIKQKGRMAREYVNEFRRVVSKLPLLPESLLMHLFEEGLDPKLHQACLYRGSHITLNDWYQVAIELDDGLRRLKPKLGEDKPRSASIPSPFPHVSPAGKAKL